MGLRFVSLSLALLVSALLPLTSNAAVDYARDVKPILKQHCYACHGALKQKAHLRLDTAALLRAGGEDGPLVVSGQLAEQSPLVQRVTSKDPSERMPPDGDGLEADKIATLREWIGHGAPGPIGEQPEADPRSHWAFQRIERPPVPEVTHPGLVANPIDAFLVAAQESKGLTPLPPADKPTLLRRVYLDLTGLPPTREDLHAFLADTSSDAYEKVVDRLLASPAYGERWGRHWMDVWRYSDWYGRRSSPDVMNSYPTIWRWRDWIVRSLNEDKGYDRMVTEMLAADEVEPGDDANAVATGFIVRNWFKWNYNQWMRDQVEHTGKAFLGLTMNCCHCHDHKYDPVSKEEYFKFRAFFEPLELRQDRVAGEPDPGPFVKYVYGQAYGPIAGGMVRVFDENLDAQTFIYNLGDERNKVAGRPPVEPGVPGRIGGPMAEIHRVELPPIAWYPGLRPFVRTEERAKAKAGVVAAEKALIAAQGVARPTTAPASPAVQIAELNVKLAGAQSAALEARVAADDARYPNPTLAPTPTTQPSAVVAARAASRAEREAALIATRVQTTAAQRAVAAAQQKGSVPAALASTLAAALTKQAAAEAALTVEDDHYTPLSPVYPHESTGRRTALAAWITSRDNPLAARVAANHIWLRHFGAAIVPSVFDFGRNGKPPTNPQLLDWLAAELMDSGWHMKHLHRLIVMSEAYKRASAVPGEASLANVSIDPDNVMLWHFNNQRMEAEEVRDSLIATAGVLDRAIGGRDIDIGLGLTSNRRSIYFTHQGEERMKFLEVFDAAVPTDCYKRTDTVVPQQALALANSDLSLRCARVLAERLGKSAGDDRAFVVAAFEQVLTREPSTAEEATCSRFLRQQATLIKTADAATRAREDLVHALLNHNDFVAVR